MKRHGLGVVLLGFKTLKYCYVYLIHYIRRAQVWHFHRDILFVCLQSLRADVGFGVGGGQCSLKIFYFYSCVLLRFLLLVRVSLTISGFVCAISSIFYHSLILFPFLTFLLLCLMLLCFPYIFFFPLLSIVLSFHLISPSPQTRLNPLSDQYIEENAGRKIRDVGKRRHSLFK